MMFGSRQLFRACRQLCLSKSVSRPLVQIENHCRNLLDIVKNERIIRNFTAQTSQIPEKIEDEKDSTTKHPVARINLQLNIMFTCKKCSTRNSKVMSKLAYQKGVVIIRCDGCKNNHLIADNLEWFGPNHTHRNIEKIMKLKGENVKRLTVYGSDVFEVVNKDEAIKLETVKIKEIDTNTPEIDNR